MRVLNNEEIDNTILDNEPDNWEIYFPLHKQQVQAIVTAQFLADLRAFIGWLDGLSFIEFDYGEVSDDKFWHNGSALDARETVNYIVEVLKQMVELTEHGFTNPSETLGNIERGLADAKAGRVSKESR